MRDAARVLERLEESGSLGSSGLALRRELGLEQERLEAAIQELWSQGLVKEVTHSKPNTWALRSGFQPQHAAKRRWRLSTQGQKVMTSV